MTLELWNTIAAWLTLIVIAATAIAAVFQLRHMRAGNDLQGLLKVLEMAYEPAVQDAFDYLTSVYPQKMTDPAYLKELEMDPVDSHVHKELIACEYYERLGSYVKNGLISADFYLDCSSPQMYWEILAPIVAILRKQRGCSAYENFEYLVVLERQWNARHPDGNYPKGVPRITIPDPATLLTRKSA